MISVAIRYKLRRFRSRKFFRHNVPTTKNSYLLLCGFNYLLFRSFVKLQKKLLFLSRLNKVKALVLKTYLKKTYRFYPYSLMFLLLNPSLYVKIKEEIRLSQISKIGFKFFIINRIWLKQVISCCPEFDFTKTNNGLVLNLYMSNQGQMLQTLLLLEQSKLPCFGLLFFNRFINKSYFFYVLLNLKSNFKLINLRLRLLIQALFLIGQFLLLTLIRVLNLLF